MNNKEAASLLRDLTQPSTISQGPEKWKWKPAKGFNKKLVDENSPTTEYCTNEETED
jgi:hypothetical protein